MGVPSTSRDHAAVIRPAPHHHQPADQGWTTRKRHNGDTEWIPPAHLDHGQPRTNTYHHPEKLLRDDDDDDGP
jgi:hypothetical protein